jgi:hypothetical protein
VKRELRPKPDVGVTPATVSQLTSLAALGIDERRFLEQVVPLCRSVAKVGRLRVVPVAEALRALEKLAPADEAPTRDVSGQAPSVAKTGEDEAIDFASPDEVLARLGRRRVG